MQVVLLAIRALITCMDITPRAAASLVEGGALRPMCRRLLEIEDMDVAEACLKCIHLLSKVSSYPVCYGDIFSFLFFFFSIPFIIFALCFFLSLLVEHSRNSDPGSHSRLFSPPTSPLRFVPCFFIATIFQLFLPSSTRVELCLPTLGALSRGKTMNFYLARGICWFCTRMWLFLWGEKGSGVGRGGALGPMCTRPLEIPGRGYRCR